MMSSAALGALCACSALLLPISKAVLHGRPQVMLGDVHWKIEKSRGGAEVKVKHSGCPESYTPKVEGDCIFHRDHRPWFVTIQTNLPEPVELNTTLRMNFTAIYMTHAAHYYGVCPMCGSDCNVQLDGDGQGLKIAMPPCPIPAGPYQFYVPTADMSSLSQYEKTKLRINMAIVDPLERLLAKLHMTIQT
mmetsp:Transcript_13530/g.39501  ORF Transcript_13530/g.39501 Transcript_13530/m.39501 type:complete len:190 (-) Transcript_13530:64-633(-)